jgi:phosphoribosylformylglycinamidine synthase
MGRSFTSNPRLRDNSETADQEFALIADKNHKGLIAQPTYDLNEPVEAPFINTPSKHGDFA